MWYKLAKSKILYIMRGLPGSGKSTLAKQLGENGVVFSTDDFFMVGDKYEFNPKLLGQYHQQNLQRTIEAMKKNISPIVVDNTNTLPFEMKQYVIAAEKYGYKIQIKEPQTDWAWDAQQLAEKNTHKVPQDTIQKMIDRYDKNVDLDYIKKSKAPWENE